MLSGSPPNSFPAAASRLGAGAEREGGGSSSGIRALVGVQLASSTSGDAETSLFPSLPGGDHCPVSHPKTSAGLPALPTTCRRRSGAVRCSEHSAGAWGRWQGRLHLSSQSSVAGFGCILTSSLLVGSPLSSTPQGLPGSQLSPSFPCSPWFREASSRPRAE